MSAQDRVASNLAFLDSMKVGEVRGDPDRAVKVETELPRTDYSHNGFYLVTELQYNQHGRITGVSSPELDKELSAGLYSIPEVTYFDGAVAGTIGLGLMPEEGELPREYRRRLEDTRSEDELFEGPAEAVEVLDETYLRAKTDSWNDIELSDL